MEDFLIKSLWMVGILALGGAGVLFGVCGWEYFRAAPEVEQDTGLSVVEEFKRAGGHRDKDVQKASSPLVQQAKDFALYLNPPAPPKRDPKPHISENVKVVAKKPEIRPVELSPQFELHGISYYRSKPEESLALVWEPGSGQRWIKKGAKLGHFVVEEVKSTSILYRDGTSIHELAVLPDKAPTKLAQENKSKSTPKKPNEPEPQRTTNPAPLQRARRTPPTRIAAKSTSS